jgi:hypothetical protein
VKRFGVKALVIERASTRAHPLTVSRDASAA